MAPSPQFDASLSDRMNERLAAMQASASRPAAGNVSVPTSLWGTSPATVSGPGGGGTAPVSLSRGGVGTGPAIELTRGGGHGMALSPALAPAPAAVARTAPAPEKGGDATARRTLAGATLMGPIADRAVLSHVTPVYPDWAKHEGVEGSVTLYFVVRPDGSVRE